MVDAVWKKMIDAAKACQNPKKISPFIEAGGVSAAILTESGNIYTGVCIDTACSLGMCAERSAVAAMITHGESRISRLVCIMGNGTVGMPCGACQELMMQLGESSGNIQILKDLETGSFITLKELIPNWWGSNRFL